MANHEACCDEHARQVREDCARECEGKAERLKSQDCEATRVRPGVVEMALECADAIRAKTSQFGSQFDAKK